MIKRTVNYEDFDGNSRVEDLYFNLTKTELIEMSMDLPEDVSGAITEDTKNVDEAEVARKLSEKLGNKGVYEFVKNLVLKSYGIKSEDGRRFVKSPEISKEFSQTLAYDAFLMELLSDDNASATFLSGIIPKDMVDKMTFPAVKQ